MEETMLNLSVFAITIILQGENNGQKYRTRNFGLNINSNFCQLGKFDLLFRRGFQVHNAYVRGHIYIFIGGILEVVCAAKAQSRLRSNWGFGT